MAGMSLLPVLFTPGSHLSRQPSLGTHGLLSSSHHSLSQPEAGHSSKTDITGVSAASLERQHMICTQSYFTKVYNLGYKYLLLPSLEWTSKFCVNVRPDWKSRIFKSQTISYKSPLLDPIKSTQCFSTSFTTLEHCPNSSTQHFRSTVVSKYHVHILYPIMSFILFISSANNLVTDYLLSRHCKQQVQLCLPKR